MLAIVFQCRETRYLRIRHNRGQSGIRAAYVPFNDNLWRFPEHFIPEHGTVFSKKLSLFRVDFSGVKRGLNWYANALEKPVLRRHSTREYSNLKAPESALNCAFRGFYGIEKE